MADIVDQASALEDLQRDQALAAARQQSRPPSRICLNCDEPLHDRFNFCDPECRNDYERRAGGRYRTLHVDDD